MMRHARSAFVLAAGIVLTAGCGSDNPTGSSAGTGVSGTVYEMDFPGVVVPGVAVASGDSLGVSGADGRFFIEGVEAPYDLVSRTSFGHLHIYSGYYQTDETAPRAGGGPQEWQAPPAAASNRNGVARPGAYSYDSALISGSITNHDVAGGDIWFSISEGLSATWGTIPAATASYTDQEYRWPNSPTTTVRIAALQLDSTGGYRYAISNNVVLSRGSTANVVNLALNPVAGTPDTLAIQITEPVAATIASATSTLWMVRQGVPVRVGFASGTSTQLPMPAVTGATFVVVTGATYASGAGLMRAVRPGVTAGPLTIDAPEPPTYSSPADAATGLTGSVTFGITPSTGATANIVTMASTDPYTTSSQYWYSIGPGAATSVGLPVSDALGATLSPETTYLWQVWSVLEGDVDGANVLHFINSTGYDDIQSLLSGPRTIVHGGSRSFTTSPNP